MKCQICGKREATVHYKELKDDMVEEMHICDVCADEKGFGNAEKKEDFSFPDLLGGMADEEAPEGGEAGRPVRCDRCGLTYLEFKASGRLGCAGCYQAFRAPIVPLLRRIHGSDRHIGKMPSGGGQPDEKAWEIRRLKEDLDRVVREENFEEAARIRDEIRKLEGSDG